jgi:purine nucleoside permease
MPNRHILQRAFLSLVCLCALALPPTSMLSHAGAKARAAAKPRPVKALIISMFGPEAEPWITSLALDEKIALPGLSADYPEVSCNADDVCQLTTGMGHTNAAASVAALVFSGKLDLKHTYFLIAGIAGIDPTQGTLGSAAWARYLIDYGIAWELDSREKAKAWPTGYLGINTRSPSEKPSLEYRTEVFQLDEKLLQKALALSESAELEDSPMAMEYRANWPIAPANQPPRVVQCDTAAGDTWWHGEVLERRAQDWTMLLTDGLGKYCTTQQEDNASYESLKRGAQAGLLDLARVAVLRTASNFDRPYPGQSAYDSLVTAISGGFVPATRNLYYAGGPVVADIVAHWESWKDGVPE